MGDRKQEKKRVKKQMREKVVRLREESSTKERQNEDITRGMKGEAREETGRKMEEQVL